MSDAGRGVELRVVCVRRTDCLAPTLLLLARRPCAASSHPSSHPFPPARPQPPSPAACANALIPLTTHPHTHSQPLESIDGGLWTPAALASAEGLRRRFDAADVDGNGVIDRDELRTVLEATSSGAACTLTHWLTDEDVDAVLRAYGGPGATSLTRDQFSALLADGVLLDGQLTEYESAFKAADAGGSGTISATELADLLRALGRPLKYDALVELMARFDVDASGKIDFTEFLRMFRKEAKILDLAEILDYITLTPAGKPGEPAAAGKHAPPTPGSVAEIETQAELDKALEASRQTGAPVILMASLTWCRPCRALARPLATLASAYPTATFLKLYGNTDDNTKRLFRDVLKVRSTPTFFVYRGGELVHTHTGARKDKLEHAVREAVAATGAALPETIFPVEPKATGGW